MRYRYIALDGVERTIENSVGLADAIRSGHLRRSQQLFDSAIGRWMPAGQHESAAAAFAVLDAFTTPHVANAPARTPEWPGDTPLADNASATPIAEREVAVTASAIRRIVARFLDSWILGLPFIFAIFILHIVLFGPFEANLGLISPDLRDNNAFWTIVGWFGVMLLDPLCTMMWGGSPGKLLLELRVRSSDGSPLNWSQAWSRSLLMWVRGLAFAPSVRRLRLCVGRRELVRVADDCIASLVRARLDLSHRLHNVDEPRRSAEDHRNHLVVVAS